MIYILIFFILIFFVYKYDYKNHIRYRDLNVLLVTFIIILFSAFRYRVGLDTIRYMSFYPNIPSVEDISFAYYILSRHEPLYFLIEVIAKTISPDFFVLQLIQALFVNLVIIYFFKKNTKYIFTSILLYYLILFVTFNFEAMRSSMAVAVFLMSYAFLKERKLLIYFLFSALALMLHSSALVLFILPFVPIIKINNSIFIYFFITLIISFIIGENIETIFNQLSFTDNLLDKANNYLDSSYSGQVLTLKGVISSIIMYLLIPYFVVKRLLIINNERLSYEFMIVMCIIVSILAIKVQLFERIRDFFMPFLILGFAEYLGTISFSKTLNKFKRHYAVIFVSVFIFLKIYGQYFGNISGIPNYKRYLPYHTIINEKKSQDREYMYFKSYRDILND